jgi:AraC-like DNA-binding protein
MAMSVLGVGEGFGDDGTERMPFGDHRVMATSDFEEADAAVRTLFPAVRLHPRPHSSCTWGVDLTLNALRVGEATATCLRFGRGVHVSADELKDYYVSVPLRGAAEVRTGTLPPVLATRERAVVFAPDAPAEVIWSDRSTQMCVMFARHTMRLELEALLDQSVVSPIVFTSAMDLTTASGKAWTAALGLLERHSHVQGGVLEHPLASANLEKMLIDNLLLSQPHNYTAAMTQPRPASVPQTVRQAIELLHGHPEKPWTTATLAREVAVSARSLQEGFHRSTGVPPMRYLRDVRLERVHADLLEAAWESATVAQIARRWGFLYLGRFAATYREKFGETPSETLRSQR